MGLGSPVWIPLRSNLAYFELGKADLDFESRLKQLSILNDRLLLEQGTLHLAHSETNLLQVLYPPGRISVENRTAIENDFRIGQPFRPMAIGGFEGVGMAMVLPTWEVDPSSTPDGNVQREFRMRLESGVIQKNFLVDYREFLEKRELSSADWMELVPIPEEIKTRIETSKRKGLVGVGERQPVVADNRAFNTLLVGDLGLDLAVSAELELPMAVDGIHGACLAEIRARGLVESQPAQSTRALELLVPNFSGWSWESVTKWRMREELSAFRSKLSDLERAASGRDPDKTDTQLLQEANAEIVSELGRALKKWPEFGTDAALAGLGFAPPPIPQFALIAGVVALIARGINILDGNQRSWAALLVEMQEEASKPNAETQANPA